MIKKYIKNVDVEKAGKGVFLTMLIMHTLNTGANYVVSQAPTQELHMPYSVEEQVDKNTLQNELTGHIASKQSQKEANQLPTFEELIPSSSDVKDVAQKLATGVVMSGWMGACAGYSLYCAQEKINNKENERDI